jgi:hypothetical protein
MASAPRDGTPVLVGIRPSEQGPGEVDVARWAKPEGAADPCWISADSDPDCVIIYAEAELSCWMPAPSRFPPLRSERTARGARNAGAGGPAEEIGGSGI